MRYTLFCALVLGLVFNAAAVQSARAAGTVDAATRHQVVAKLVQTLNERYVFPDRAAVAATALASADRAGTFDTMNDADVFAKALTDTMAQTLHDKHLHVSYYAEVVPPEQGDAAPTPEAYARFHKAVADGNFGIAKVIRLRGNVGYLDMRGFAPANMMGDTLAAAMNFLANTDSLIVDLRKNGGGDPAAVSLLCSYFLHPWQEVHINDFFLRTPKTNGGVTQQFWATYVPGTRYVDKPLYVLTSAHTFSGGEEFAYDVQALKLGTLVGETTGGGANPGDGVRLADHFDVFMPNGRAINPITHTNWEGVGVKPDIATTADTALSTAYLAILNKKSAAATNADDRQGLADLIAQMTKDPGSILLQ